MLYLDQVISRSETHNVTNPTVVPIMRHNTATPTLVHTFYLNLVINRTNNFAETRAHLLLEVFMARMLAFGWRCLEMCFQKCSKPLLWPVRRNVENVTLEALCARILACAWKCAWKFLKMCL